MAWLDLGLRWIEKLMSPTVMLGAARFFVIDPPRSEQRLYAIFSPTCFTVTPKFCSFSALDTSTNYSEELCVAMMARFAAMGERTLLRRFHRQPV